MHGLTIATGAASNLPGEIPLQRFLDFLKEKWPGQHTPVEKKQSPQSFIGISSESLPVQEEWYVPGFLGSGLGQFLYRTHVIEGSNIPPLLSFPSCR